MKIPAFLLLPAAVVAQAIDEPWSLVPAAPTACYESEDSLAVTVAGSLTTLDDAIEAQDASNDDVGGQVSDMAEEDPFAMAARMQEYAMKDPAAMQKMMEGLATMGQNLSQDMTEDIARERELVGALDDLVNRYEKAFAVMREPFEAAVAALPTRPSEAGEVYTQEAIAQLPAINQQGNADYEAFCEHWWKPGGQFATVLDEYRAFLADDRVPRDDEVFEQTRNQWMIQGLDVSSTHSIAAMDAVRDYLKQVQRIYALRVDDPTQLQEQPW